MYNLITEMEFRKTRRAGVRGLPFRDRRYDRIMNSIDNLRKEYERKHSKGGDAK